MFDPNIGLNPGSLLHPPFCSRNSAGEPSATVFRYCPSRDHGATTRRLTGSCGLFFHDRFSGRIGTPHLYLITDVCLKAYMKGVRNFGHFQDAETARTDVRSWKPSSDTSEQPQATINQIFLLSLMLFRIAAPL